MDKKKTKTRRTKSETEKRFTEVSRKLGIAIPAGLFLLISANTATAIPVPNVTEYSNSKTEIQKLLSNEVISQLLHYAKRGPVVASAADCQGLHSDDHVDTVDPDVTNNGQHDKVHTNTHGDSCRY